MQTTGNFYRKSSGAGFWLVQLKQSINRSRVVEEWQKFTEEGIRENKSRDS